MFDGIRKTSVHVAQVGKLEVMIARSYYNHNL